jgi:hypothetical protein
MIRCTCAAAMFTSWSKARLVRSALQIAGDQTTPVQVMLPVDGTRLVAVQVAAITGKGN